MLYFHNLNVFFSNQKLDASLKVLAKILLKFESEMTQILNIIGCDTNNISFRESSQQMGINRN